MQQPPDPTFDESPPDHAGDGVQEPAPLHEEQHGSLRGTFVLVVAMASFFVVTWFGMFWLAMDRR